jgi:hypothetical protein
MSPAAEALVGRLEAMTPESGNSDGCDAKAWVS